MDLKTGSIDDEFIQCVWKRDKVEVKRQSAFMTEPKDEIKNLTSKY